MERINLQQAVDLEESMKRLRLIEESGKLNEIVDAERRLTELTDYEEKSDNKDSDEDITGNNTSKPSSLIGEDDNITYQVGVEYMRNLEPELPHPSEENLFSEIIHIGMFDSEVQARNVLKQITKLISKIRELPQTTYVDVLWKYSYPSTPSTSTISSSLVTNDSQVITGQTKLVIDDVGRTNVTYRPNKTGTEISTTDRKIKEDKDCNPTTDTLDHPMSEVLKRGLKLVGIYDEDDVLFINDQTPGFKKSDLKAIFSNDSQYPDNITDFLIMVFSHLGKLRQIDATYDVYDPIPLS